MDAEENPFNDGAPVSEPPVDFKKAGRQKQNLVDPVRSHREPPNAIESEQGVLGCILLSPSETIPQCIDEFKDRSDVFYDLRHRAIYEMIVSLYDNQKAIDNVTVLQALRDANQLDSVGGIAYLASLPDAVPSAANLLYYVEIVKNKAALRQVITACTDTIGRAYDGNGELGEFLEKFGHDANKIIQGSLSNNGSTGVRSAKQLVPLANQTMEAIHQGKKTVVGLSTGFPELDKITLGLHPGQVFVIAARPSVGKAQPLTAKVLTPTGFVEMGSLKVGDWVIGVDGEPIPVLAITEHASRPVVRVTLSDGTSTECCEDHLWLTETRNERRFDRGPSVKSTKEIIATIKRADNDSPNHALPLHEAVLPGAEALHLPMHPWLLGALIGDGSLTSGSVCFCKPEKDVQEKVASLLPSTDMAVSADDGAAVRIKRAVRSNSPSHTATILAALGLRVKSHERFIPAIYLSGSVEQRLQLLQGLLDTDGSVTGHGSCIEYSSTSLPLFRNVLDLARGLGFIASALPARMPKCQTGFGRLSWRTFIHVRKDSLMPVTSQKHKARLKLTSRKQHRSIASIQPVGNKPCRCIHVAADDGLYLTDDYIPTHNSSIAMNIAEHVAMEQNLPVGVFSLEMPAEDLMLRMICSRARVDLRSVMSGQLADTEFPKLTTASVQLIKAPLYIDDSRGLSILQAKAKARQMVQQYGIKFFIFDYLQLMHSSNHRAQNRDQEVGDVSQGIKELSGELDVPIILVAQLNREVEKQGGRRPRLSDLRESGRIEQDADSVGFLYRTTEQSEDDYWANKSDKVPVNLLIAKQRNGPTGEIPMVFHRSYTRFESAATANQPSQISNDPTENWPGDDE